MRPGISTSLTLLFCLAGCGTPAEEEPRPRLYLRGAELLTLVEEETLSGHAIVIDGDRIEAVEPERTEIPLAWTVLDLDGLILLPAFIDNHVHITVPFITRFRKDVTGGLDEEQIRGLQSAVSKERALEERKQSHSSHTTMRSMQICI